ncbi:MAG TPA: hypothetical protein VNE82_24315 [Candidatus Binataceae bacterium]|nr:hypothetical protein [Candidatus Binataceae bacterium]
MAPMLPIVYLIGVIGAAWFLSIPTMSREQRPLFRISSIIWPLTMTVFGLLVLLALLTHWYGKLAAILAGHRVDSLESPGAADVHSRVPRSHLLLAALLAASVADSGSVISQTKVMPREPKVIASAATEFVHARVHMELPRIMTWRPLPVTTPTLHRRARPRGAPTPNQADFGPTTIEPK